MMRPKLSHIGSVITSTFCQSEKAKCHPKENLKKSTEIVHLLMSLQFWKDGFQSYPYASFKNIFPGGAPPFEDHSS